MSRAAPAPLTREEEALVRGSTVVRRLAPRMARRTRLLTIDELVSIGHESLTRAARHFDPSICAEFDGYAYRFVHLDMLRAIEGEARQQRRERPSSLDVAYHHLESATDPGDLFADSAVDARRHASELAAGIFVSIAARFLGEASRASVDDVEQRIDHERRRTLLRSELEGLGESGRVLTLRYLEGLEWEPIASSLAVSVATARRDHDSAMKLLAARMMSRERPAP